MEIPIKKVVHLCKKYIKFDFCEISKSDLKGTNPVQFDTIKSFDCE